MMSTSPPGARRFLLELLAAGMGDGAEVFLEVLGGHADAVVGDGKRARVLVKRDADGKVIVAELNTRVGETLEVELVHRIRRVGDKLTQEDLLVGVDRVDHEVEELLALGLNCCIRATPFLLSSSRFRRLCAGKRRTSTERLHGTHN